MVQCRFQSVQCEQTRSVSFLSQNDDNPGLFWTVDSHVVHTALGRAGAPIPQGMGKSDGIMKMHTLEASHCAHISA